MKGLVTDPDGVVVVIDINQTGCVYFTHSVYLDFCNQFAQQIDCLLYVTTCIASDCVPAICEADF